MKRFYLAGHDNFGNRGCEALVRSTHSLLRERFGKVELLVPSANPDIDRKQWPEATEEGVLFVPALKFPHVLRWWARARRLAPRAADSLLPRLTLPHGIARDLCSCDAVLLIGGDMLTLDYGAPSLVWCARFAQSVQRLGVPTMLWGASVGPFDRAPELEKYMQTVLGDLDAVSIRESVSAAYLDRLGIAYQRVADPAFVLRPQPVALERLLPAASKAGVLGLNISPLVVQGTPSEKAKTISELCRFLDHCLSNEDLSVLLVPHVDPLDGGVDNSDSAAMRPLAERYRDNPRVRMLLPGFNAAQLKFVIAHTTYFIGARTHSTIAAISSGVPTGSIAYSSKARGLNRDLFGDERLLVSRDEMSADRLRTLLLRLIEGASLLRGEMGRRNEALAEEAARSPRILARLLEASSPRAVA